MEIFEGYASEEARRTVLAQLGPVQNIDRLAGGQRLRMAPDGITLVYGENGSGKSGYTRIAKRLCRSLSVDQLRGNVFATDLGPKRVEVRYRIGDEDVSTLDWDPATNPPSVLRQISVFDSHNARLYVDGDNRIAYLPRELANFEHHGETCASGSPRVKLPKKGSGRTAEGTATDRLYRGNGCERHTRETSDQAAARRFPPARRLFC